MIHRSVAYIFRKQSKDVLNSVTPTEDTVLSVGLYEAYVQTMECILLIICLYINRNIADKQSIRFTLSEGPERA